MLISSQTDKLENCCN